MAVLMRSGGMERLAGVSVPRTTGSQAQQIIWIGETGPCIRGGVLAGAGLPGWPLSPVSWRRRAVHFRRAIRRCPGARLGCWGVVFAPGMLKGGLFSLLRGDARHFRLACNAGTPARCAKY